MLKKTVLAGITVVMISCSSNEKKEEKSAGISDVVSSVSNLNKLSSSAEKMEDISTKLKAMKPLSNDELKTVVPETVDGLKRKSFSAGNYGVANMSTIEAEYSADDSKYIKINIIDGAGEAGSAIISMMVLTLSIESESESNGKKSRTTEIDGVRYMTEESKSENSVSSSLKFLHKDRYSVSLDGQGYSLEELQAFLKKLDLSALK